MEEYEEILKDKRPIIDNDVASILPRIQRPEDVDEKLFSDVVENMIANRNDDIRKYEDDPQIRNALVARENEELQKNALLDIKLTVPQKRARFYPSVLRDAIPKFYSTKGDINSNTNVNNTNANNNNNNNSGETISELEYHLRKVADLIQKDINDIFRPPEVAVNSPSIVDSNLETEIIAKAAEQERKLTDNDVEIILSTMDYGKFYVGDRPNIIIDKNVRSVLERDRKREMENQLRRIKIKPHRVPKLTQLFQERFFRGLAVPSKYVGNIMASSFGEAATQQTLNTFHSAGDRNGRKQLTGLPKFMSIVEVQEKPHDPTITIFMKNQYNEEQLRNKIPIFQMTVLGQVIDSYRILGDNRGLPPSPRWEQVSDIVRGVPIDLTNVEGGRMYRNDNVMNYVTMPNINPPRLNTHRGHPAFSYDNMNNVSKGRILEIKFDVQELFFRKITLGQIADAIEEENSLVRVVTSSMDIGLIYIYYPFKGLNMEPLIGKVEGGLPSFAEADPFTVFLKQAYFPKIKELQIGGVYGITYVSVQSFALSKAIDKQHSSIPVKSDANGRSILNFNPRKRLSLYFKQEDCDRWALNETTLIQYITMKLNRYATPGFTFDAQYFEGDGYRVEFNTVGLMERSELYDELVQMTKDEIIYELENVTKFPITELIRTSSESELAQAFDGEPIRVDNNGIDNNNILTIEFDANRLLLFGFEIADLADTILDVIESDVNDALEKNLNSSVNNNNVNSRPGTDLKRVKLELTVDEKLKRVTVKGIPSWFAVGSIPTYVKDRLTDTLAISNRIENAAMKWYYEADGNNLIEILAHPEVDARYTRSDNIVEIFQTLGAESCRTIAMIEIAANVKEGINPVHIELLADSITSRTPGDKPLAQNRNGLAKRRAEFIARGFETTTDVFMKAGLGQVDNLQSFSSQIMVGTLKRSGGLAETDRKRILRSDVFQYDFPRHITVKNPNPNEVLLNPSVPMVVQQTITQENSPTDVATNDIAIPLMKLPEIVIVSAAVVKENPALTQNSTPKPTVNKVSGSKKPLSAKEKLQRAAQLRKK